MKKQLLTLLVLMMLPLVASAYDAQIDGIYYNFSDTEATVTYQNWGPQPGLGWCANSDYTGSVNIPEAVSYKGMSYPVTSIGKQAFRGCSGLTSVSIPNSVKSIGVSAFEKCTGLSNANIPNDITSIENGTFYDCSNLKSIVIPNSVTTIGYKAFNKCI